jgi:hypothetical protein
MRNLSEYALLDWIRLVPVKWILKGIRNRYVAKKYSKKGAVGFDVFFSEINKSPDYKKDKNVLISIAFQRPEVIELQCKQMKKYLSGGVFVVVDNSRDEHVASKVAKVCSTYGVPYLKLPMQSTSHPNRSHSLAIQWSFDNVIQGLKPEGFAFLDHDIVPFRAVAPFSKYKGCAIFGRRWDSKINHTWQLWAGFAFFRSSAIRSRSVSFMYDFSSGLDTMGEAYEDVFSNFDCQQCFATCVDLDDVPGIEYQLMDSDWIHLSRTALSNELSFEERMSLFQIALKRHEVSK